MATIEESLLKDLKHKSDLVKVEGEGDFDCIEGMDNVKEALLRRLVTEPGTLIHRPDYGVGIKRFINAPATISTKRQLAMKIQEQFERDERVDKVLGVQIKDNDYKPEHFTIIVRVKLVGYGEQAIEFIPFGEVP